MKKLFITLGIIIALALPVTAFTAASDTPIIKDLGGFCGINATNLTNKQNGNVTESYNKMMNLRKENVKKMVTNGTISKLQGDAYIRRIDEMVKYYKANGLNFNQGMGGFGMMYGYNGYDMMSSYDGYSMMNGYSKANTIKNPSKPSNIKNPSRRGMMNGNNGVSSRSSMMGY